MSLQHKTVQLQKFVGTHGARIAGMDCMNVLAALSATSSPEGEEPYTAAEVATSAAFQKALLATDGLEVILGVARSNGPPASAGFAATIVHEMFRNIGPDLCGPFATAGGIPAMVRILQNTYVTLPKHAAAAGCLWYFLVPDQRLMLQTGGGGASRAATMQLVGDAAAGTISGKADDVSSASDALILVLKSDLKSDKCMHELWTYYELFDTKPIVEERVQRVLFSVCSDSDVIVLSLSFVST